jgi:hypothetical protein
MLRNEISLLNVKEKIILNKFSCGNIVKQSFFWTKGKKSIWLMYFTTQIFLWCFFTFIFQAKVKAFHNSSQNETEKAETFFRSSSTLKSDIIIEQLLILSWIYRLIEVITEKSVTPERESFYEGKSILYLIY